MIERFRIWRVDIRGTEEHATLVYDAEPDSARTFYVEAPDSATAKRKGREAFNAYYAERQRRKRAAYREDPCVCNQCGRPLDTDGDTCSKCREDTNNSRARAKAKARGEKVTPPDWKGTRDARREEKRVEDTDLLRLSHLEEFNENWNKWGHVRMKVWVRREIAVLRERTGRGGRGGRAA